MRKTTLCFLMRDDQILLAMKKRGHGAGKWNGVGGKAEGDESVEAAIIREANEEIGVTPTNLVKVAIITFRHPPEINFDNECTVFTCNSWEGNPAESEEMKPQWFRASALPYQEMWESDAKWLPKVLAGRLVVATVFADVSGGITDYIEEEVDSF